MLVSEIKSVGNAVFLEVLVMEGEIGFLAIRIKISYVEDSRQCLFIHFIANRPIWYIFACNIVSSGKIKGAFFYSQFWNENGQNVKYARFSTPHSYSGMDRTPFHPFCSQGQNEQNVANENPRWRTAR